MVNSYTSSSDYTEQGSWVATVTTGAWAGDFGPDVNGDGVQELYVLPELLQNLNNQLTVVDGATAAELYTFAIPLVNRPGCLVAGSDGRIYITGRNNDVIVSYLPDGTDPQTHVTGEGSNFSTQIAEGKAGEWYIANRFNVTGLPADAGSIVISTDNFATTSVLIAGTEAADLYNGIASFDSAGIVEGPATAPEPGNNATDVLRDGVLSWTSGPYAVEHQVYFGDSFEDVNSATVPASSGQDVTSFDPGRLDFGKTYFWRVDEVNEAEAVPAWTGPVWSLSIVSAITVDDFEGYSNLSPNRPFQTWLDGFGYSADAFFPVAYGGNGTGSGIGHDIWSPGSVYFDGTLMETGNTLPGSSQSMPFYYTNANGVASQTERTFAQPQDWTIGGAKTLSINFFGQAGNTGTLYVKINNNKITYPYDAANMVKESWQAWNIDLSSMNVQAVTKLQIGMEGTNASGMILIDDIKLRLMVECRLSGPGQVRAAF